MSRKYFYISFGIFIPLLWFHIYPLFFTGADRFPELLLLPHQKTMGIDLFQTLNFSLGWIENSSQQFLETNIYPPLTSLFFSPLTFLSFKYSFMLMTLVNLVFAIWVGVFFPYKILNKNKATFLFSVPLLIMSLMTYPLLFEIERGQFNLVAMGLGFSGLYYFRVRKKNLLAYTLLTLGIQLKLYPAILVFLMRGKDDRSFEAYRRFILLGLVNITLLFCLGYEKAKHFFNVTMGNVYQSKYVHEVNHSVQGFVALFKRIILEERFVNLSSEKVELYELFFIVLGAMVLVVVISLGIWLINYFYRTYSNRDLVFSLMGLVILSMLLPGISHDYKISYMTGPIILLLTVLGNSKRDRLLAFAVAFLYSTTLWHFWDHKQSSVLFRVNTIALVMVLILLVINAFSFWKEEKLSRIRRDCYD